MNLSLYLLQANLIVSGLFFLYWLLLRKETFYQMNRFVLLSIIVLGFALPRLDNPLAEAFSLHMGELTSPRFEPIEPVDANATEIHGVLPELNNNGAVQAGQSTADIESPNLEASGPVIEWKNVGIWIYLAILVGLVFKLIIQLMSMIHLIVRSKERKDKLIYTREEISPSSFLGYIILNPTGFDSHLFRQIIAHEKVHVKQWHSFDLIIVEILVIICWFNPVVWMLRRSIRMNLEYIADQKIIGSGENKKVYQYNLLRLSAPELKAELGIHFSQKTLKNRILMMNKKKSKNYRLLKYLLFLPFAFILTAFISPTHAQDEVKKTDSAKKVISDSTKTNLVLSNTKAISKDVKVITQTELATDVFISTSNVQSVDIDPAVKVYAIPSVADSAAIIQATGDKILFSHIALGGHDTIKIDTLGNVITVNGIKVEPKLAVETEISDLLSEGIAISNVGGVVAIPDAALSLKGKVGTRIVYPNDVVDINVTDVAAVLMPETELSLKAITQGIAIQKSDSIGLITIDRSDDLLVRGLSVDGKMAYALSSKATPNHKNIFLVISRSTTKNDLEAIREECQNAGLDLKFKDVRFTSDGRIEKFSFSAKDGLGLSASLSNTYGNDPADKVFIYWLPHGDDRFGFGANGDFEESQVIPVDIKKLMRDTKNGYTLKITN